MPAFLLLYGEDEFRLRQKLEEIVEFQKARQSGLDLIRLDFAKIPPEDFYNEVRTLPIFGAKKLIILENVFSCQETSEKILEYFSEKRGGNDLFVFVDKNLDKHQPLFNFLKENGQSQEFSFLGRKSLIVWINKEAKNLGARMSLAATEKLADYFKDNLWALENEIKKLAAFNLGMSRPSGASEAGRMVESEDIDLLSKPILPELNIFKTVEAISRDNSYDISGNPARYKKSLVLQLIRQSLETGESPVYLLAMIAFQFRNLLAAKGLAGQEKTVFASRGTQGATHLAKVMGVPYFAAKNYYSQAQKFTLGYLKRIYSLILESDLNIKTGRVNPRQEIELLVSRL